MPAPRRDAWRVAQDAWRTRVGAQLELDAARPSSPAPASRELDSSGCIISLPEDYPYSGETQREYADRMGWTADGQVEQGEWHPTEGWVN